MFYKDEGQLSKSHGRQDSHLHVWPFLLVFLTREKKIRKCKAENRQLPQWVDNQIQCLALFVQALNDLSSNVTEVNVVFFLFVFFSAFLFIEVDV